MLNPPILLIHGIWNHRAWLKPLADKMRSAGFAPTVFSYNSILGGPEAALPQLIQTIERMRPVGLVGHSLGGLMALEALQRAPHLDIPRVVCLGSPLRGSLTARHMAKNPALRYALGSSRDLLTRGFEQWEGKAEVGVVAGTKPRGLGRLVAPLEGPSDGTVLVSETHLQGMKDHCQVRCGHTELVFSNEAVRQTSLFLRIGQFA